MHHFWGAIALSYKDKWGYLFTNDIDVITLTAQMIPILWVYNVFDSLKCIGVGEIRGIGRPIITVWGNLFSTIIVGYPVGLLLAFKFHWGLQGVWIGMTIAWAVAGTIYLIVIFRIRWKDEIELAAQRNKQGILSMKKVISNDIETLNRKDSSPFILSDDNDTQNNIELQEIIEETPKETEDNNSNTTLTLNETSTTTIS